MAGMLRLKDEGALQALLAKGNLREARGIVAVLPKAERAPAPAKPPEKVGSDIEELLAQQIRLVGNLPEPIREYCHLRGSKHRMDFAWPEWRWHGLQIGVEVQGMVHRASKEQFKKDIDKRAAGLLQHWVVLEVGGDQVRSGRAMEWLQELFKGATKS